MIEDLKWSNYDFSTIPFDDIVELGQRSLIYRDLFCVSWLLGRYCNFKCSYCWPYARSDKKDHRPTELVLLTLDEIKRQSRERNYNSFHFSFSGGEPTLHPGYLDIIKHYNDDTKNCNYQSVHMTTNVSPGLSWFKRYIDASRDLHRVSVTASWHKEWSNREEFAGKLEFLQENAVQVTVNMVMVPKWWELLYSDALYFHDRGINVTLKPQSDPTASWVVHGYSKEQLDILHNGMPQRDYVSIKTKVNRDSAKSIHYGESDVPQTMQVELKDSKGKIWYMDQAERFNAFNFNSFTGWLCESGYRSIIIREPDGSIKRSYSCSDEPLGNIETGFKLFDKPMPCISPNCVSSADSKIPKRKQ